MIVIRNNQSHDPKIKYEDGLEKAISSKWLMGMHGAQDFGYGPGNYSNTSLPRNRKNTTEKVRVEEIQSDLEEDWLFIKKLSKSLGEILIKE